MLSGTRGTLFLALVISGIVLIRNYQRHFYLKNYLVSLPLPGIKLLLRLFLRIVEYSFRMGTLGN